MIPNDLIDYAHSTYYFEMERKNKLHDSFRVYLIVLSICIGYLSFYSTYVINNGGVFSWIVWLLLLLSLVIVIIILFLGWKNPEYLQCPTAKELIDKRKQYLEDGDDEEELNDEISDLLLNSMVKCAHINTYNNKTVGEYIDGAKLALIIYALLALISFFPWVYSLHRSP